MYLFCVRRNKKAQKKGYDDPTSILARLCIQLKYQVKVRWFQEKRGGVDWTDPPTETAAWTGTQEGHREARAILVLNGRWVHHLGISQGCWTVSSTRWIQKTGSGPIMEIKAALPNTNLFFFLFFFFSAVSWLRECSQSYMMINVSPNLEVGSGMLGRGQGHSESDTGNDTESCFPVQPSPSQDTLQPPSSFPGSKTLQWNDRLEAGTAPYFFLSLWQEEKRGGPLNFQLPDKLECGKVPFLGLHEGATSENGPLACEKLETSQEVTAML